MVIEKTDDFLHGKRIADIPNSAMPHMIFGESYSFTESDPPNKDAKNPFPTGAAGSN